MKLLLPVFVFMAPLFAVAQCDDFELVLTPISPSCHDFYDGKVDIDISGGTSPYSITMTNEWGTIFFPGKSIEMVPSGWYYVHVTDSTGCELYDSVFVPNPDELLAQITVVDPSFTGACDGYAEIDTVTGYQGAYANVGYFWSPGGPYGIGATTKTGLCDENYNVVINDETGCQKIVYLSVGSVGLTETKTADLLLYPIPATNFLWIEGLSETTEITLYDLSGTCVRMQVATEEKTQLDIRSLPKGVYFLKFSGPAGRTTRKVIIS